jgi:hypothetical protein
MYVEWQAEEFQKRRVEMFAMIGVSKLEFYENHLICGKQGEMGTLLSESTNKHLRLVGFKHVY